MIRRSERILSLSAVGIVACFLAGIGGWKSTVSGIRIPSEESGYFHEGKSGESPVRDPACQTKGCHGAYPHEQGPESAFRNLHVRFVECPVCHGREGEAEWRIEAGDERWRIRTGTRRADGGSHPPVGPPVRCRECHSRAGRERIERGAGRKLQGDFTDPVALRMLEEGSREWVPGGM